MKLLVSDYEVVMAHQDSNQEFFVKFTGPKDSPYEEVSRSIKLHYDGKGKSTSQKNWKGTLRYLFLSGMWLNMTQSA